MDCINCGRTFYSPPGNLVPICSHCIVEGASEQRTPVPNEDLKEMLDEERIGDLFPEFEMLGVLGRGGMGVVYKARQRSLDRLVAIKVLNTDLQGEEEFEVRFEREAKAMAQLNHPNIVGVLDFGNREGLHYFVMEYVPGQTVQQLLAKGEVHREMAFSILEQLCVALHYAHQNGVIHRDIKPGNILVSVDGIVKVGDFGLASLSSANDDVSLTGPDVAMGTPTFAAPEQVSGKGSVDARTDIYSLGVVAYVLFTGQLPSGNYPAPTSRFSKQNARLDETVLRAMSSDPDDRFSNVEEILQAIRDFSQQPIAAPPPESSNRSFLLIYALGLIFIVIFCTVALQRGNESVAPAGDIRMSFSRPVSVDRLLPASPLPGLSTYETERRKGGKLRVWTERDDVDIDTSAADGIEDLVFVSEGINTAMSWYAARANGTMLSSIPGWNKREDYVRFYHSFWIERPNVLHIHNDSRSNSLPILTDTKRVTDLRQTYDVALLMEPDGGLGVAAKEDWVRSHQELLERLTGINDVLQVDTWGNVHSVLRQNGESFGWIEPHGTFEPPKDDRKLVHVEAGGSFLIGLYEDGSVATWCHPISKRHSRIDAVLARPEYEGPVIRVAAFDFTCAIQRPDGTWYAWGDDQGRGLIDKVNSLGVALDLCFFSINKASGAKLLWIEPREIVAGDSS
ncbi:MAG: hypothetical protein CMO55_06495 [Verrucomicrobiales bacterium]|nr:hypothetical protein [Verrucomicrobiales bacterium]